MPTINASALEEAMPRLRARFESSRALVQRARARAERTARHAEAMRQLLSTWAQRSGDDTTADRDIWNAAAAEIMRASVQRDRAIGVLAHELRQPLAAALAAHRLLGVQPGAAVAARATGVLDRQLLHLSKLVDRLMDFSGLAVGAVNIDHQNLDLRDTVARAIETIDAPGQPARRVSVACPPEAITISGDGTRLVQVFSNLLQNAVRYSSDGDDILVAAAVDGAWARVTVTDSGAGIAADAQRTIFEPFARASGKGQGLGIGLALARVIVELHGGRIEAASGGAGRGSTFTVTLPLAVAPRGAGGA